MSERLHQLQRAELDPRANSVMETGPLLRDGASLHPLKHLPGELAMTKDLFHRPSMLIKKAPLKC